MKKLRVGILFGGRGMTEDGLSAMPKRAKILNGIHEKRNLRSMSSTRRS
jgi:hypothetical protein